MEVRANISCEEWAVSGCSDWSYAQTPPQWLFAFNFTSEMTFPLIYIIYYYPSLSKQTSLCLFNYGSFRVGLYFQFGAYLRVSTC